MSKIDKALRYLRTHPGASLHEAAKIAGCTTGNVYDKLNPAKRLAGQQLRRAVKRGVLKRDPCFVCGAEKTQGHHVAYDMPLDVVWLCLAHHCEVHNGCAPISQGDIRALVG